MPSNFDAMTLKIAQFETTFEDTQKTAGTLKTWLDDKANYSLVPYKEKKDPKGWAIPYVTGHRYRNHWGHGLDFDRMTMEASVRWEPTDKDVRLVFNFTEKREEVSITPDYGKGTRIANKTLVDVASADWKTGDYVIKNITGANKDPTYFEFVVNGKDKTRQNLRILPWECAGGTCIIAAA